MAHGLRKNVLLALVINNFCNLEFKTFGVSFERAINFTKFCVCMTVPLLQVSASDVSYSHATAYVWQKIFYLCN